MTVDSGAEVAEALIRQFRALDPLASGNVEPALLSNVLRNTLGFSHEDIEHLLNASGSRMSDATRTCGECAAAVRYEDFVRWLLAGRGPAPPAAPSPPPAAPAAAEGYAAVPQEVGYELAEMSERLTAVAKRVLAQDPAASAELVGFAKSLRELLRACFGGAVIASYPSKERPAKASTLDCITERSDGDEKENDEEAVADDASEASGLALSEDGSTFEGSAHPARHAGQRRRSEIDFHFREHAAQVVEKTGRPGEPIDDLQEVPISEVKDKLAISYWRFCEGLRVYRSDTVTQALRLICSAPVPGLGGTSYLEVFQALTDNSEWENHIYLFGGLVRDILRRTVGNDIDIGFSAPAAELSNICKKQGYICHLDGDYILIGDERGDEYLEGMVISYNGIQPPEHADFSMNTLFYDFKNDIIIDKIGTGVPAVVGNKLDIPCPRDRWKSWIDINGVRVCFRYFKFLLRGYSYAEEEMSYVTEVMIDFWSRDAETVVEVGRVALGSLVGTTNENTVEELRHLVFKAFNIYSSSKPAPKRPVGKRGSVYANFAPGAPARRASRASTTAFSAAGESGPSGGTFFSAGSWWRKGWMPLLRLTPAAC